MTAALLLAAVSLSLATTNDYFSTAQTNAHLLTGYGLVQNSGGKYPLRYEDRAFIEEAYLERCAVAVALDPTYNDMRYQWFKRGNFPAPSIEVLNYSNQWYFARVRKWMNDRWFDYNTDDTICFANSYAPEYLVDYSLLDDDDSYRALAKMFSQGVFPEVPRYASLECYVAGKPLTSSDLRTLYADLDKTRYVAKAHSGYRSMDKAEVTVLSAYGVQNTYMFVLTNGEYVIESEPTYTNRTIIGYRDLTPTTSFITKWSRQARVELSSYAVYGDEGQMKDSRQGEWEHRYEYSENISNRVYIVHIPAEATNMASFASVRAFARCRYECRATTRESPDYPVEITNKYFLLVLPSAATKIDPTTWHVNVEANYIMINGFIITDEIETEMMPFQFANYLEYPDIPSTGSIPVTRKNTATQEVTISVEGVEGFLFLWDVTYKARVTGGN